MKKAGKIALGVGIAGAAALAAYLYSTKEGKKARSTMSAWAIKAREEVTNKVAKAKDINEVFYNDIVKKTVSRYENMKGVDPKELAALGADLKKGWASVKKELKSKTKKVSSKTKAPARKATKAVKKAVSKKKA